MCVDYKGINDKTIPMSFPCPSVNDAITDFHGKKIFSKFDIIKAFYNILVDEKSKPMTAFVTKRGAYVWNVMPFGGKNCPATWSLASEAAFRNMKDLIKYIDDFTIASINDEEHLLAIEQFFKRLQQNNLKIKLSKCTFFQSSIEFVGHTISEEGIKTAKKYMKEILQSKRPRDKSE